MVIVFCIEPVGTFTACTMKVIPKRAMITVTTADSKYSRQMVFGGPTGFTGGGGVLELPLRLSKRVNVEGLAWLVDASPLVTFSSS